MIKILLVDDHDLVRLGVKRLLQDTKGIQVVGEARTGEEAIKLTKELSPDIVIMDLQMPGIGGLEATRKMLRHNPMLRVLALTVCEDEPYPSRLLQAGAAGYITKGSSPDEMLKAVRKLYAGERYLSPEIAQQLALKRFVAGDEQSLLGALSERELQIMLMITQGQKTKQIADKLFLSVKTINSYRYRIFKKLEINSDVELTLLAMRLGLLDKQPSEES